MRCPLTTTALSADHPMGVRVGGDQAPGSGRARLHVVPLPPVKVSALLAQEAAPFHKGAIPTDDGAAPLGEFPRTQQVMDKLDQLLTAVRRV